MTAPVELTRAEAEAIVVQVMASTGMRLESFPPEMQLNALAGAMNIVRAMQVLGYRVSRPLVAVR